LTDETKNLVSVSTAVVATITALVLGLLISNVNTSFTRLGGQVTALSAEILRLDHILRRAKADPGGKNSTAGTGRTTTSRVGGPQSSRTSSPRQARRREVIQALRSLDSGPENSD